MKLKILIIFSIIGIAAGTILLNCTGTDIPAAINSEPTIPGRIDGSPEYEEGKFNDMGTTLDMSFSDFFATTWDFLFTKNNRTPNTDLPLRQVDLSHFNNQATNQLNAKR